MSADPETDTIRALTRQAAGAGVNLTATVIARRRWASALFEGVRLTIDASARDHGFDTWLSALPEAELKVRGHFLADAEMIARPSPEQAVIELLVLTAD